MAAVETSAARAAPAKTSLVIPILPILDAKPLKRGRFRGVERRRAVKCERGVNHFLIPAVAGFRIEARRGGSTHGTGIAADRPARAAPRAAAAVRLAALLAGPAQRGLLAAVDRRRPAAGLRNPCHRSGRYPRSPRRLWSEVRSVFGMRFHVCDAVYRVPVQPQHLVAGPLAGIRGGAQAFGVD